MMLAVVAFVRMAEVVGAAVVESAKVGMTLNNML